MSSTNKTTNYNLSQFVGTDVPSYLGDYNSDMSKIDKAIGDVANSQGSVEQSVVGLTAEVQGLSTQVSGVSTSVQQLQTSVAQIDSGYKQADTTLSQRITTNANNIQTNTTAIEGINTTIGTEDISGIGDATIKGAISNLNSSLSNIYKLDYGNAIDLTSIESGGTYNIPSDGMLCATVWFTGSSLLRVYNQNNGIYLQEADEQGSSQYSDHLMVNKGDVFTINKTGTLGNPNDIPYLRFIPYATV